ncbi:hypothetical protein E5161_07500 [Cohnella pontilimi]|uniref:Uncharacterized protein n=1 Tax=Cohnella pontilimi TaxID=2564100 RepID=A0A4U0FD62_9BACL|nr:hypothetical protein [Cohnella pontilimi]TJY42687.1 hypothetical protein E5161_07500 [Cohnella pontilimi]
MEFQHQRHLDMLTRTNISIIEAIRKGKTIEKHQVIQYVKEKNVKVLFNSLITGMMPHDNEMEYFHNLILDSYSGFQDRFDDDTYNNGLFIIADLIQLSTRSVIRSHDNNENDQVSAEEEAMPWFYKPGDENYYNERDYYDEDREINPEAEAWGHFKEYIDEHD